MPDSALPCRILSLDELIKAFPNPRPDDDTQLEQSVEYSFVDDTTEDIEAFLALVSTDYDAYPELDGSAPEAGVFPREVFAVIDPDSTIGLMMAFIAAHEHRPQPVLRFAAALSWMAHLAGRKVRTSCGLRTNLMLCGIAGTACGKEAGLRAIDRVEYLTRRLPDDGMAVVGGFTSDAGLIRSLVQSPNLLSVVDEFGRVLRELLDPKAAGHLSRLVSSMLSLATSAGKTFKGLKYAEQKRDLEVFQPCWNLYGVSTPDPLLSGFTSESVTGGLLPRMLFFSGDNSPKLRTVHETDPPQKLIEQCKGWRTWSSPLAQIGGGGQAVWVFDAESLALLNIAGGRWYRWIRRSDEGGAPEYRLFSRAEENAKKVALVLAVNHYGPCDGGGIIEGRFTKAAILLVDWCLGSFFRLVAGNCSDTMHGRFVLKVLQFIEQAGKSGLPLRKIKRKFFSVEGKTLDGVLAQLVQDERIILENRQPEGGGRPAIWFRASSAKT